MRTSHLFTTSIAISIAIVPGLSHAQPLPTGRAGVAARAVVRTLPNVTGKPVREAIDSLAWTQLPIIRIALRTTSAAAGTVVRQGPPAGTPVTRAKAETLWVATALSTSAIMRIPPTDVATLLAPPATNTTDDVSQPPPTATVRVTNDSTHATIDATGIVVRARTSVPDLYRNTPGQVSAALEKFRLRPGHSARDYSDDVAAGLVYRQHPPPGTVLLTGDSVDVWYSIGPHPQPPTIVVPAVIGLPLRTAVDSLRRAGLFPGHLDRFVQPRGNGNVVDQKPGPGSRMHRGDSVDLAIAVAPRAVKVPSVTGLTRSAAEDSLRRVGLGVGAVTLVAITDMPQVIVRQSPPGGQAADSGTLVDLVENRPPETRRVRVPDLSGLSLDAADSALRGATLFLGTVFRPTVTANDRVVRQTPPAGTSAFLHTAVDVTLGSDGSGLPLIEVPDVTTLRTDSAQRVLVNRGFTRLSISNPGGDLTSTSVVLDQDPRGGEFVNPSRVVSLVAGAPAPAPEPVPNLVGMDPDFAGSVAATRGLQVAVGARLRRWRLSSVVMAQAPAPPALPPPDRTLTVTVAIPVVPPLPAAVIGAGLLFGMGTTLPRVNRWRKGRRTEQREPRKPADTDDTSLDPPGLSIETRTDEPTIAAGEPSSSGLVRASIVVRIDVTSEPVDATAPPGSLVKSWKPHDA